MSTEPFKFKPCPFCGSEDVAIETKSTVSGAILYTVRCQDCYAETGRAKDRINAVLKWEQRTTPERRNYRIANR